MGRKSLSQPKFNLESVQECGVEEVGHVQAKLNRNGWYLCCQLLPVIFMLYFFFFAESSAFWKMHSPHSLASHSEGTERVRSQR